MKFGKEKFNNKNDKPETLPEKEKRLVREIEKLPADALEKINLLLVWRGFKSWTKLTYLYKTWGAGDPEPDLTPERKRVRMSEFDQLLGFMGLAAVASKEYRKEPSFERKSPIPGKEYRDYYIAPKLEIAEETANRSEEQEKTEFTEEIKNKIQKLSPVLYAEMIKELDSR
ncbi:MAG: hypothetical protein M1155_01125 [Patescibacteria group bacterium]|nr:hypothetical protein [Patescibacteria group bacterium]